VKAFSEEVDDVLRIFVPWRSRRTRGEGRRAKSKESDIQHPASSIQHPASKTMSHYFELADLEALIPGDWLLGSLDDDSSGTAEMFEASAQGRGG